MSHYIMALVIVSLGGGHTKTHTSTVSLECRSLLTRLMKEGGFWTQTPLSVTGKTPIAV